MCSIFNNALLITLLFISAKMFAQPGFISTYGGNGVAGYMGDGGAATSARLNNPGEIAIDAAGNIYFAEINNHVIRKITPAGVISTVAGTGISGYSGDGGPATSARLNTPYSVRFDASGNMYITDYGNQRIRKINTSGIITTIAGTGTGGYSGDGGPATSAMLWNPAFMYVDGPGNVYYCDNQNHRIRKITAATGIITTIAGNGVGGYSGDGGLATAAQIRFPNGMYVDAAGNVYIGDAINHRIRKVNTSGIISTIAGTGTAGFSGDGGPATSAMVNLPQGIFIDATGNIFFADTYNHRVRKINTAGIISTVAGTGVAGYSGDGGLATSAKLNTPDGVTVDPSGKVYIADGYNHRIRAINSANNAPVFTSGASASLSICVSSAATSINSLLAVTDGDAGQTLTWSVITAPAHGTAVAGYTTTSTGGTVTPTGLSYTPTVGYSGTDGFTVKVGDGAASDTITVNVTISPAPTAGVITGTSSICAGIANTLSASIGGGVWSHSAPTICSLSAGGVVTGLVAGTDVITYTVTNACGSANATFTVTVMPPPSPGVISGIDSICLGGIITLSASVGGGTWSQTNPAICSLTAGGVVTGLAGGVDTIMYTVTACGSATAIFTLSVLTPPSPGVISGDDTICVGHSVTLTESVTGGAWVHTGVGVTTLTTGGIATGIAAGVDNIFYITGNDCGSDSAYFTLTVMDSSYCTAGIGEVSQTKTVSLFPNPSTGTFHVYVPSAGQQSAKLIVSNMLGQKVAEATVVTNSDAVLNLDLVPGVYVLEIVTGTERCTQKVTITR